MKNDKMDKGKKADKRFFAIVIITAATLMVTISATLILNKNRSVYTVKLISAENIEDELFQTESEITVNADTDGQFSAPSVETENADLPQTSEDIGGLININTADAATLMKLDGIGEVTAAAIIEYRSSIPFTSIEDIKNVKGIGEKKFEAIKDKICI